MPPAHQESGADRLILMRSPPKVCATRPPKTHATELGLDAGVKRGWSSSCSRTLGRSLSDRGHFGVVDFLPGLAIDGRPVPTQ